MVRAAPHGRERVTTRSLSDLFRWGRHINHLRGGCCQENEEKEPEVYKKKEKIIMISWMKTQINGSPEAKPHVTFLGFESWLRNSRWSLLSWTSELFWNSDHFISSVFPSFWVGMNECYPVSVPPLHTGADKFCSLIGLQLGRIAPCALRTLSGVSSIPDVSDGDVILDFSADEIYMAFFLLYWYCHGMALWEPYG